jgi:hypothetical protein
MAVPYASALPTTWIRVDALRTGNRILYDNAEWIVCDVLPMLPAGGMAVVAYQVESNVRAVLPFPNPAAVAALLNGGGFNA